ncbi:MAG TPA: DUF1579 domain-containing protein [Thermoanaerobaculia bacterium]|jgi:hypothetical protein
MTTTETTESEQHPMPVAEKEHLWLKQLVGEWTFEGAASMGPDKPEATFTGRENVRMLGDVWLLAEGEGEVPGGGVSRSLMTLGYDPQKQRFVGTYLGSMMTNLWVYEGSLDATEKVLTLETEGPGMSEDRKYVRYRDTIEIESDDRRSLSSQFEAADGTWTPLMKMTYSRMT